MVASVSIEACCAVICKDCKYSLQIHLKSSWLVLGVCASGP